MIPAAASLWPELRYASPIDDVVLANAFFPENRSSVMAGRPLRASRPSTHQPMSGDPGHAGIREPVSVAATTKR